MNDKLLYWRRTIEVTFLAAALIVMAIRWKEMPKDLIATLIGLIGLSLATGQSPLGNVATVVKRTVPPPPPPPPETTTPDTTGAP